MSKNFKLDEYEIKNSIGLEAFYMYVMLNNKNKIHGCNDLHLPFNLLEWVKVTIKPVGKIFGSYSEKVCLYKSKNSYTISDLYTLRIEKTIKIPKSLLKYEKFEITMKINGKTIKAESLNKLQYVIYYKSDYPYRNVNIYLNLVKE